MKKQLLSALAILIGLSTQGQEEGRLLRFPSVGENQIVFTYAGDLFTVPLNGGVARKLTSHNGFESFSRFSPDGKTIAFTGQYDGNTEVFTIPSTGGVPKRLTYTATLGRDDVSDRMGPNNVVMTWTPDGKSVVYRSRKQTFNDFKGQLFNVSVNGGLSEELPLPEGGFCSYSADGKQLAFNKVFREFRTWKYYKGGMADDIWIYDFASKKTENITDNVAQDLFPMWIGEEIFFLSDRDRIMNIFCYNLSTKQTTKVTNFTEYDVKFPSFSKANIVFENGGFIYKFDVKSKIAAKVNILMADDAVNGRPEQVDASKRIFSVDVSPNGERVLFSARGDVFSVPATEGITRNLTATSNAHERRGSWSPDGRWIAYLSDASCEYEIWLQPTDGHSAPYQLTTGGDTYKFGFEWSPNSKKILWNDQKGQLQLIDIESRLVTLVRKTEFGRLGDYSWSPDSRWIALADGEANDMNRIFVYNVESKEITAITDSWYTSYSPTFSSDGKYLLFISDRDFNPTYSDTEWNHIYQKMSRVYLVLLSKDTKSPFAPENSEVKPDSAPTAEASKTQTKNKKTGDKESSSDAQNAAELVKIDFSGIASRILQLPIEPSNYYGISSVDGKVYYNTYEDDKGVLKFFDLKKKKETTLGEYRYQISANNKKMLVIKGNTYAVIDLPSLPISIDKTVDLSGMKMVVDYHQEWTQIFDESWRQMRDFFYVKNMHGVDWKHMHDKYAVLLPYVNQRADLTYVIGEMIGELSIGHAYTNSGDMVKPTRINTGLLGAKLSRDASGFFRIDQILEGATWSESLRSPLMEPGVNVATGNFIVAVNGTPTNSVQDIYSLLVGLANKQVEVSVNSKPMLEGARKVIVVPIDNESDLYYYRWVQDNIRKVDKATNGQVGYIHIPDMGVAGLNEFIKYFYPQLNKKALIIDDRGNGGGNVSPMILERLSRVPYRYTVRRNSTQVNPVPDKTLVGPKIALIDKYSASDGDLFPYGFRQLGLGKLVGQRSWGGVVGISGSLPFVDGADLRVPQFTSISADKGQYIIEGHGVDPDVEIVNDPAQEYAGNDQQLNKAIELILKEIESRLDVPAVPSDPDKSK
ncbi:S41 family peptidase [Williamwhitmania taraxaci]|uniref:Tricorn protease homolog n=1 Tax=Williamwhitmania taraxaci TaxID=1640674 RepID=A0A1G6GMV0_9BACT|nr:S41 family peptidase [Williamwhitmania taraxaci]SDB83173.1 tricorn protease [Williamwhitmania taraxaci]